MEYMKEQFAEQAHVSWGHWMEYLFSKSQRQADGSVIIPASLVERWERQTKTEYSQLSEQEKQSDRQEAERFLAIVQPDEVLQNGASGCNKLGEDIVLYLPNEEGLDPSVVWSGCAGYDAMTFYVESEEEAHALFYALIAIKDVEAD